MRIVILGSGEGTNAVAIMKAAIEQQLGEDTYNLSFS